MKGQVTLELLIILAALLAFLALWLPVAFKVKSGFDDAAANQYDALAQSDLENACEAVREMGSGSQRVIAVRNGSIRIWNENGRVLTNSSSCP